MSDVRVPAGSSTGGRWAPHNRHEASDGLLSEAPLTQPQLLELAHGNDDDRLRAATAPEAGPAVLSLLARDDFEDVYDAAQSHPNFTAKEITRVFEDDEHHAPAVLRNQNIGAVHIDIVSELALEGYEADRATAGANPYIHQSILERLGEDQSWLVRAAVAANPATPSTTRAELIEDPDPDVRQAAIDGERAQLEYAFDAS